jgi:hypothetical protein
MYQKRPGWILTGVAPNLPSPLWGGDGGGEAGVTLDDIQLAVQTEIPLVKQHLCDQLWAARGQGAHASRFNRLTNEIQPLALQPSSAADLRHAYATVCRFFPGARDLLAALDDELCHRLYSNQPHSIAIFEDQQCTAGQLYGLATGQDRFIADLRPLVQPVLAARSRHAGHCCHPYDICTMLIAEEAGVIVTAPDGQPLDAPLDTETNVAWLGYANRDLKTRIETALRDLLIEHRLIPPA